MRTEPAAADFDSKAVVAMLVGTWRFSTAEEPMGTGLIHFTETGRATQFVANHERPDGRLPARLWYSVESPTHLRIRPKPDHQGWLRGYRLDGQTLSLIAEHRTWLCTRPSPEELPQWFHSALAFAFDRS